MFANEIATWIRGIDLLFYLLRLVDEAGQIMTADVAEADALVVHCDDNRAKTAIRKLESFLDGTNPISTPDYRHDNIRASIEKRIL